MKSFDSMSKESSGWYCCRSFYPSIAGDPLKEIFNMGKVGFVMKGGEVFVESPVR